MAKLGCPEGSARLLRSCSHLVEVVIAQPGLDVRGGEVGAVLGEALAELVDVVDEGAELLAEEVHAPETRDAREEGDAAEGHGEPDDHFGAAGEVADVVGHEGPASHGGGGGKPGVEVRDFVQNGNPHPAEHRKEDEPAEVDCDGTAQTRGRSRVGARRDTSKQRSLHGKQNNVASGIQNQVARTPEEVLQREILDHELWKAKS